MSIFKIDRTFIAALHKRLQALRKHYLAAHYSSEDTPDIEDLEEIISTMIWASTQHEEAGCRGSPSHSQNRHCWIF
jgi:hypothetical protein